MSTDAQRVPEAGIVSSHDVGSLRRQPITSIASAASNRSRTLGAAPMPAIPR